MLASILTVTLSFPGANCDLIPCSSQRRWRLTLGVSLGFWAMWPFLSAVENHLVLPWSGSITIPVTR